MRFRASGAVIYDSVDAAIEHLSQLPEAQQAFWDHAVWELGEDGMWRLQVGPAEWLCVMPANTGFTPDAVVHLTICPNMGDATTP